MNWFKENKFLAVGLVVGVLGAAALGYFLWDASDRYAEAVNDFQVKSAELARLRGLSPYPDRKNLDVMEAQRADLQDSIDKLHSSISSAQFPLETMSEVEFQDRLKAAVVRISGNARKAGVTLPEKFYLGFDQYQAEPPRKETAPQLGRQLKAIEWVVDLMISQRVKSLDRLDRVALPEEESKEGKGRGKNAKAGEKAERVEKAEKAEGAEKAEKEEGSLVRRETFEIHFRSEQPAFREILNQIARSSQQFYVVTELEVKNEKDKGPLRATDAPDAPSAESVPPAVGGTEPAPTGDGTPSKLGKALKSPPKGDGLRSIVGDELIEVSLRVDAVHLQEGKQPDSGTAKKGGKGR